jgi:hypothetical protein
MVEVGTYMCTYTYRSKTTSCLGLSSLGLFLSWLVLVLSCLVLSCLLVSCFVVSCRVLSCRLCTDVATYLVKERFPFFKSEFSNIRHGSKHLFGPCKCSFRLHTFQLPHNASTIGCKLLELRPGYDGHVARCQGPYLKTKQQTTDNSLQKQTTYPDTHTHKESVRMGEGTE